MLSAAPISLSARISAKPCGDREVRDLLKRHLANTHFDDDTIVLDELGLCQGDVRIDVASVNGELSGYEIKSPADTLARWPKQCRIYSKVVDRAWLVATEKTLEAAQAPGWWGVIRIVQTRDQLGLRVIRPAQPIRRRTRIRSRACCGAMKRSGRSTISAWRAACARKRRAIAWRRLAESAPLDHLRAAVRAALKVRANRIEELHR